MFKKLKDNKILRVFGLAKKDCPEQFITITSKMEGCLEHLKLLFRYNNSEHYTCWCNNNDFEVDTKESIDKYFNTCVSESSKAEYVILPMEFRWSDIVAIMRMFAGCVPLGASFDTAPEYKKITDSLERQAKLYKSLEELGITEDILEESPVNKA